MASQPTSITVLSNRPSIAAAMTAATSILAYATPKLRHRIRIVKVINLRYHHYQLASYGLPMIALRRCEDIEDTRMGNFYQGRVHRFGALTNFLENSSLSVSFFYSDLLDSEKREKRNQSPPAWSYRFDPFRYSLLDNVIGA